MLNDARYNIFSGLVELGELFNGVFDDLLRPLVDFLSLVDSVRVNNALDDILYDLVDLS